MQEEIEVNMIHELGHALAFLHTNKNKRRLFNLKIHTDKNLGADLNDPSRRMTPEEWNEYSNSIPEKRARLWEGYYKKMYYKSGK